MVSIRKVPEGEKELGSAVTSLWKRQDVDPLNKYLLSVRSGSAAARAENGTHTGLIPPGVKKG